MGNAELLQREISDTQQRPLVASIIEAARRAAGLTAQMLAYAGKGDVGPRAPADLGALIKQLRVLDATLSKKATVTLATGDGPEFVNARETAVARIL